MSLADYPLISDWLALHGGRLTLRSGKVDIGQRLSTALVQIARHELALPVNRIAVAPVRTGESPDEGITSGSNSIEQSGRALRLACATLRGIAQERAAARFGGDPADWRPGDGGLTGPGSNRPMPIPDLVGERDLARSVDPEAPLRAGPMGSAPMLGIEDMVTGRYRFVHDIEVAGMLHARVVRPPHALARLNGVNAALCDRLLAEGIRIHRDGAFLAVAGEREWPVVRAADRLARACDWQLLAGLEEGDIFARLTQDNAQRLTVQDGAPCDAPIPAPLEAPDHAARYERPFTMHGALAPSAALAVWDGARLEITTHSQGIYVLRQSIAESLGLTERDVILTHAPGSGCYGHNGADDAAFEAALVARALPDTPILLKWSREDEHVWEPYGPPMAVELAARIGEDGGIAAFSAEAIGGTFRGRPRSGLDRAGPARLLANWFREAGEAPQPSAPNMNRQGGLQRNLDPIYAIAKTRYVKNLVAGLPLRTSALRCLGATANVFAIESFMDELARAARRDPVAYRLAQLDDPRAAAVLGALRDKLAARPSSGGRGIAYGQYKNAMTRVAVGVDLDVSEAAEVRLHHAVIVADAGAIIDRDGLSAQLEGGFLQAASWALYEAVTWDRDGVTSRDWDSYPVLRFDNVPEIEVVLLDRPGEKSLGAGEAAPGPAVAAIANAVFDATGLRLRRLPFTPDALRAAALAG